MPFDYEGARRAGYSDAEIQQYLGTRRSSPAIQERKDKPGFQFGEMVRNIPRSLGQLGKDIVSPLLRPVETAKGLGRLATGAVAKTLVPGKDPEEETVNQLIGFYAQRYGGLNNLLNTIEQDPAGLMADVSAVLGGVGMAAKGTKLGGTLSKLSRATDPLMMAGKVGGAGVRGVSRPLSKIGDRLPVGKKALKMGLGSPSKARELDKMIKKTGIYQGLEDYIEQNKLQARDVDELENIVKGWKKQFDVMGMKSPAKVNIQKILDDIDKRIDDLINSRKSRSEAGAKELKSLIKQREEVIHRWGETPGDIPVGRTIEHRRNIIDPDIPRYVYRQTPSVQSKAAGVKSARDVFRGRAIGAVPELKKVGMDIKYGEELAPIFDSLKAREMARSPMGLGRVASAIAGGQLAGVPGAIAGYAANEFLGSPGFYKAASKIRMPSRSRIFQGVSKGPSLFSGRNMVRPAYDVSKYLRMINNPLKRETNKRERRTIRTPQQTLPKTYPSIVPQKRKPKKLPDIKFTR